MISLGFRNAASFKKCVNIINESNLDEQDKKNILDVELILRDCVKNYLTNRSSLEVLQQTEFLPEVKESLLSCYSRMPVELKNILNEYKSKILSDINKCPYCLISEADTNDHFMPKGQFPEFSFYLYNLIPCCTNCNRRKGARWLNDDGRMFFNPYFDVMPKGIIDVEVSLEVPNANFFIASYGSTLSAHVKYLDIIRRFNDQGNSVVSGIVILLNKYPDLSKPEVFAFEMRKEADRYKGLYGENHYEYLIYHHLSQNEDVLNRYLLNLL